MIRLLCSILILLATLSGALAQTGSAQSKASITNEINTNLGDNTSGAITPTIMRQALLDMLVSSQQFGSVNAQTGTSYTVQLTDYGQLVTFNNSSSIAVTLPQAVVATGFFPFNVFVSNIGSGTVTITPASSTINGVAHATLTSGQSFWIVSDGVNYQTAGGLGGGITNCPLFNSTLPGCAPPSGGGTVNFLRADGTWNAGPGSINGPGSTTISDFACWNNTGGTLLSDCGGAVNSQSGNYTIAATDCNGTVVETGAFKTITLPASLVGFPAYCQIRIVNGNSSRAQEIAGAPANSPLLSGCGGYCLPPTLSFDVAIVSSVWKVTRGPGPWQPNTLITVFADASAGNANNDGLAAGSGNAVATLAQAYTIACSIIPLNGQSVAISFTGTMSPVTMGGCGSPRLVTLTGTGSAVIGDGGTPTSGILECDDTCTMQILGGFTIAATGIASINLQAQRGGIMDVTGVTFTSSAGSNGVLVRTQDHGNINLDAGNIFAGGAGSTVGNFLLADRGGTITTQATQTVTGTWATTNSCAGTSAGVVDLTNGTFSGGTFSAGANFTATTAGGVISTTHCPGATTGSAVSPGWSS